MKVLVINNITGKIETFENVKEVYYPNLMEFVIVLENGREIKFNDSRYTYHY